MKDLEFILGKFLKLPNHDYRYNIFFALTKQDNRNRVFVWNCFLPSYCLLLSIVRVVRELNRQLRNISAPVTVWYLTSRKLNQEIREGLEGGNSTIKLEHSKCMFTTEKGGIEARRV